MRKSGLQATEEQDITLNKCYVLAQWLHPFTFLHSGPLRDYQSRTLSLTGLLPNFVHLR